MTSSLRPRIIDFIRVSYYGKEAVHDEPMMEWVLVVVVPSFSMILLINAGSQFRKINSLTA
jgi:hypothetical protein